MSSRRKCSLMAQRRMQAQYAEGTSDEDGEEGSRREGLSSIKVTNGGSSPSSTPSTRSPRKSSSTPSDQKRRVKAKVDVEYEAENGMPSEETLLHSGSMPAKKKRKGTAGASAALHARLFGQDGSSINAPLTCEPPMRQHSNMYHRPLLLDAQLGPPGRSALLRWYDMVSKARKMPWRKDWIDPESMVEDEAALRLALERRAYEVWISEVMLQQTRVAVVIEYWKRWTLRWPTVQDLAAADADDVLAEWRGLGFYSRATRLHEAAKKVTADPTMRGLLPADVATLEACVPGVGRYTAGAISAIVFGHAAPMVDGNVLRVLSRQLGLLQNVKTDKAAIDALWAAADALVKAVAGDVASQQQQQSLARQQTSDVPGRWGQALMELGSTVCMPKPDCAVCPISATCRAYAEGTVVAGQAKLMSLDRGKFAASAPQMEIEDLCTLCQPFVDAHLDGGEAIADDGVDYDGEEQAPKPPQKKAKSKQATLTSFASFSRSSTVAATTPAMPSTVPNSKAITAIVEYAKRFPLKAVKKAVREVETLVCAIQRADGSYLLHRRPEKGLLAGLWELPSDELDIGECKPGMRKKQAQAYVQGLLSDVQLRHIGELGSVPWLFSHLKLTMHVHLFRVDGRDAVVLFPPLEQRDSSRWATSSDVEAETMGTGMRKCWSLVKETRLV